MSTPADDTAASNDSSSSESPRGPSRREFLRVGGAAAAGVVVGGASGAAVGVALAGGSPGETAPSPSATAGGGGSPIEHLVVLMGENRSFDNLLGRLYSTASLPPGARFEGLDFGEHENVAADGSAIAAHVYSGATDKIMERPDPDPGEEYPHVNTQLFGTIDPPHNEGREPPHMTAPFNAPRDASRPDMSGFVRDYESKLTALRHGKAPDPEEVRQIMGGFDSTMLPVLSTLAREFAVFDHWHCAVPSQTFCNRSFFHASTSHGFVTNVLDGGYEKWLNAHAAPTVFNRLEEQGLSWRVYFDQRQLISFTGFLHAPVLEKYWRTDHFATMEDFEHDAAAGTLPAYAFIEPRMVYDHNDFHPPFGKFRESDFDDEAVIDSAVSDVRAGDALVSRVYQAVRGGASESGSNALNTMLLVTFDEHGGTYDHVPPPPATPPTDAGAGEMGFTFDRLGVRVPAIAISAYTRSGTVINDEFHHAAVIATLSKKYGLDPLTDRDERARDLADALNLAVPRHPSTWPSPTPQYVPPNDEEHPPSDADRTSTRPLSPPAQGLLGLLLAKYGEPGEKQPETYAEAYELLHKYGDGLFGAPR
ncbi:alkaline phosphatase family protein [Agromyces cerinus]|uniref:phospholipase C n=1 Tax=Agromyces cerinus subsp. cerinus TaxID=232089 RepID=A0A1N6DNE6_9MICO|nr:alkaline phosphatase family protein [Agromyces cerinus]SIN72322.1 phospholipase C [Agromyces cerinus subsp. cerinus]